ncbi:MAG: GNAT family N-acetyltransferase [Nitriliruptor sp.]|nr:MAG: GNAT family N-acetyltransferase [Nitriliruptor sp.]
MTGASRQSWASLPSLPRPLPASLTGPLAGLTGAELRSVCDADADGLIDLIGGVFAEYPGCVLDLPGLDADLHQPATTAMATGAAWWVLLDDGQIVATIGAGRLADDGSVELKRLYVASSHRRQGLARGLVALVEADARRRGATSIELWSDTRFRDAHALYTSLGYEPTGEERDLHDPSNTTEYRFTRLLDD